MTGVAMTGSPSIDLTRVPSDWPLQLAVSGGEVRRGRGLRFHGTQRQLVSHLRRLNSVGTNGHWDVDREQIPEGVTLPGKATSLPRLTSPR